MGGSGGAATSRRLPGGDHGFFRGLLALDPDADVGALCRSLQLFLVPLFLAFLTGWVIAVIVATVVVAVVVAVVVSVVVGLKRSVDS